MAALVGSAVEFGGSVDGVLHAAGVAGGGPVHMLPAARNGPGSSRSNLTGTYLVGKHVIAQMLDPAGARATASVARW